MNTFDLITELNTEPLKNINLIGFNKNYGFSNYAKINDSFVVRGKSDNNWVFFSVADEKDFPNLLSSLTNEDKYLFALENWMLPYVEKTCEVDWTFSTQQYYLPKNVSVDDPQIETCNLNPEYSNHIFNNSKYQDFLTIEFISERIKKGISSGILVENQLAAWAITHDDGAIGFLHVLDQFRRRGLAVNVLRDMIRKVRKQGDIPFAYIEESNKQSLSLVSKLGFVFDKEISWVKLK